MGELQRHPNYTLGDLNCQRMGSHTEEALLYLRANVNNEGVFTSTLRARGNVQNTGYLINVQFVLSVH